MPRKPQFTRDIPPKQWRTIARIVGGVCRNIDALELLFRRETRPEECVWSGNGRNLYRPYTLKSGQEVEIRLCFQSVAKPDEDWGYDSFLFMAYSESHIVANHHVRANSKSRNEPDIIYDQQSGWDDFPASPFTLDEIVEVLESVEPYIIQVEKNALPA